MGVIQEHLQSESQYKYTIVRKQRPKNNGLEKSFYEPSFSSPACCDERPKYVVKFVVICLWSLQRSLIQ